MFPETTDDISTPINISVMSLLKLYNLCQVVVNHMHAHVNLTICLVPAHSDGCTVYMFSKFEYL